MNCHARYTRRFFVLNFLDVTIERRTIREDEKMRQMHANITKEKKTRQDKTTRHDEVKQNKARQDKT